MPGLPHFEIPTLSDNSDGWGPTTVPEQFKNVPYAPFNMGEKLGRASDWTAQAYRFGASTYRAIFSELLVTSLGVCLVIL